MKLLRLYTDDVAYIGDRKVFEYVASLAQEWKLAGVTVLEARLGFGRSAHLHQRHVFENDRAVVIEIVDDEDKLRPFAATVAATADIGLITLEAVEVVGGKANLAVKESAA
ncbi:DUF190 domain-containing protein [Sphingomonas sp. SRS2]|uniref:Uncharacterized protein n=2 Tax=Sphingomonadaceae TaxID=41297 RepID=G6EJH7_9SPHN|nr:DUF190 domain-containing protein [Sphingomonas sp. SRS2]EHJ58556.1 hypothetical protein NSU_4498 [Novosphingobium pentaromativorans US6-1]